MAIGYIGSIPSPMLQSIVDMRQRLDDLQRQLGSGQKSTTYAGLGLDRGISVSLRRQLDTTAGFDTTMTTVGVRMSVAQTALSGVDSLMHTVRSGTQESVFAIDQTGQTGQQRAAITGLNQLVALLNSRAGDRYLFSGQAIDRQSVASADLILNGDATHAGLKQLVTERRQADLGGDGLGRLDLARTGTDVTLDEDGVHTFGLKLSGASTTLTNVTLTAPAGSPAGMSVDFTGVPAEGGSVSIDVALPDGSTRTLKLTATTTSPPGTGQFTIGANATDTAVNFQAALNSSLTTFGATELTAASAMTASDNFFADPPQRVNGPPFDSATTLIDGTDANTVTWYTGEAGATSARTTAAARIDPSLTVNYGMRANEDALRSAIQNIAVFSAVTSSATDPNANAAYKALAGRVGAGLGTEQGQQSVADIRSEIAASQTAMTSAKARHGQTTAMLTDLLHSIEGVSEEQVGAQILSLQTSLQASMQTTAMLSRISLVNFL